MNRLSVVSAIALALIPKCPACSVAYSALLAVTGMQLGTARLIRPLIAALLVSSVIFLVARYRRFWPSLLMLLGAAGMVWGTVWPIGVVSWPAALAVGCGAFAMASSARPCAAAVPIVPATTRVEGQE